VLFSVLGFIVVMAAIAAFRRLRMDPEERFQINLRQHLASVSKSWNGQGGWDRILSVILVLAILGTVGTLAYVVANPKVGERFTEFYILGAGGMAADYPEVLGLGEAGEVTVGIINREQETMTYTVRIAISDEVVTTLEPVTLAHDEKSERAARFIATVIDADQKVEFRLFKEGIDEVYLTTHIWVDVGTVQ
jgi:uncharacterized membrane protein